MSPEFEPELVSEGSESSESSAPEPLLFGTLLKVAYDGRHFGGFARQENARTVAGELDGAVRAMDPRASKIRGTSRTDQGVHARSQMVAFDATRDIPPKGWVMGLAAHLPDEISVVQAAHVPVGYAPHRNALSKTYQYRVLQSVVRDPFLDGRAWRIPNRLNQAKMQSCLQHLVGQHDFRAFRAAADARQDTVRHIYSVGVDQDPCDPRCLLVTIRGNRFMYRMVRIIVGTLVEIGRGRLDEDVYERALSSGNRGDLGVTAPPDGLCLMDVELDAPGESLWPID